MHYNCASFPLNRSNVLTIAFTIVLNATEEDLQLLLSAQCHLGAKNATSVMAPYVYKRRNDGTQQYISTCQSNQTTYSNLP